jgi:3-dehydroquinate dehydratase type I
MNPFKNRIAASLAEADTEACLFALHALAPRIGLAEICLDRMRSFDLGRIIGESPCPLIISCRPQYEGGCFAGSETERLEILSAATALQCAYVDVEWDIADVLLARRKPSRTQYIVSRHWYDAMPATLWKHYLGMRYQADVVKLAGTAKHLTDVLPVLNFLRHARSPVIALAMGLEGQITRLLAPCFPHCLLTFGAYTEGSLTAPGQMTIAELTEVYRLAGAGPHTRIHLHFCADEASAQKHVAQNRTANNRKGDVLYVALQAISTNDFSQLEPGLQTCLGNLTLTADPALELSLRQTSSRQPGENQAACERSARMS